MRNIKFAAQVSGLALIAALAAPGVQAQDAAAPTAAGETVVVVTGMRASARSSVAIKKNTMEVVDSITAEDIGKLPDPNVSETLTRIPGVQGYRYGGEGASPVGAGSGITIRGLSGQTASQLNSRVYFTAGGREFNVEGAIPAMIAGIDVYKNPSAEHIEGGIGGLVNIRTRNPSDFKGPTVSLGATLKYNDLAKESDPEVYALFANRFNLANGGRIGVMVAGVYQTATGRSDNNPANGGPNFKRAIRADSPEYLTTAGANQAYAGQADTWYLANVGSALTSATVGANTPNLSGLTADQISNVMVGTALTNNVFQETIMRERKGFNAAADWKINDSLRIYGEYNYTYYLYHQNYRGLNSIDGATVQGLKTSAFNYTEGLANRNSNGGSDDVLVGKRLASGTFLNSTLNTVGGDEHRPYTTWSAAGGVEWSPSDKLDLKADYMYIKADQTQDNRSVNMDSAPGLSWSTVRSVDSVPQQFNLTGPSLTDPANWIFRDYNNGTNQVWDDSGHALALSGKYRLEGGFFTAIKFGARWAHQQSQYNNYNFSGKLLTTDGAARTTANTIYGSAFAGLLQASPDNFMDGQTGYAGGFLTFAPDALLGDNVRGQFPNAGIQAEGSLSENVGSRRYIEEDTSAAFLMAEFAGFNDHVRGNIGVRYVKTDGLATAMVAQTTTPVTYAPNTAESSSDIFLPSLNVTYDFGDDLLLRFGYGKGLTRPATDQLNPSITYTATTGFATVGNPDLKPQIADSYDLSLEKYFNSTNYLSAAIFQKNIDSFFFGIANCQTLTGIPASSPGNTNGCAAGQYLVTQTINAEPGWVKGVELSGQWFFDNLDGIWSHFGVAGSYTYVDTELSANFGSAQTPRFVTVAQPMQSKHNYSLQGIYEDNRWSARVVYTWRSDAILFGASINPIDGRYIRAYGILDAAVNYKINEQFTLSFNASNITDEALNRNVGEPGAYETNLERQHFQNGRNYSVSLRYKFGG